VAILNDGFSTTIGFATTGPIFGVIALEKTVTPAGLSGGGGIPITTMRNLTMRTVAPKSLITVDALTLTVAYDPGVYGGGNTFSGSININQQIVIAFPDGSTFTFWGFLDEFKPQENREGEQPLAALTVIASNIDDTGSESAPIYAAA